ncbi:hypothetical protein KKE03_00570 [Patescibacteria group bacterium]|nr:hypothetical protein [Patescibacteria group bacterium]
MQRGSVQLLVVFIAVIILVAGGYYYLNSKAKNPLPTIKTIQSNDYTNQSLGFTFTYPKGLTLKEDSEEEFNKRGNGDFRKNFKWYVGYEPGEFLGAVIILDQDSSYDTNPFTVWVFGNPNNLTIDTWYKNYWYYPFVWGDFTYTGKFTLAPKEEATISGQMGKSGIIDYQPGQPKFIYVAKEGKMYLFRIIDDANHTGDQILSSFKFSIEGKFCGGIAANLPENQCPEGYTCHLDDNYPDAGGKCVKK